MASRRSRGTPAWSKTHATMRREHAGNITDPRLVGPHDVRVVELPDGREVDWCDVARIARCVTSSPTSGRSPPPKSFITMNARRVWYSMPVPVNYAGIPVRSVPFVERDRTLRNDVELAYSVQTAFA